MNTEITAQVILACYGLVAASLVAWQAVRCDGGWIVWMLYCVQRTYLGLWFRWRANRRCPFPRTGPALILANHRSPLDPLMVWHHSHLAESRPRIRVLAFMMARVYYETHGLQWLCRAVQCIPVERDGQDLGPVREALRRLQQGGLVGIFPEGGLNLEKNLRESSPGVAWLALRADVPVFPVFIHDSPQGKSMIDPFRTRCRVRVTYGDPIDLSAYRGRRKSRELLQEVTTLLMERLAELGGVSYQGTQNDSTPVTLSVNRATG